MAKKTPARKPVQARSRETVAVVLEGAVQVLRNRGGADPSMAAIARRAGVSVGSIYQYFDGKDALLDALEADLYAQMRATIEGAIEPDASPIEAVRAVLLAVVAMHRDDPAVQGFLHRRGQLKGDDEHRRFEAWATDLAARTALDAGLGEGVQASLAIRSLGGVVRTALMHDPEALDDPELVDRLVAMVRTLAP